MEAANSLLSEVFSLIHTHPWLTALSGTTATGLISSVYLALKSKITTTTSSKDANYFEGENAVLKQIPIHRIGYSDRLAYVLSELSMMAYIPFEQPSQDKQVLHDILMSKLIQAKIRNKSDLQDVVKSIDEELFEYPYLGNLKHQLAKNSFELIAPPINIGACQAFICRTESPTPYIVVSFRGSERKKLDWLTNADALPFDEPDDKSHKVHSGFYHSLKIACNPDGSTPLDLIRETIDSVRETEKRIPIYLTGHSLGGAWALLATKELKLADPCACYTFGSPRVANYDYFYGIRHPVYRLVNSSDVVPRIPLGALMIPLVFIINMSQKITKVVPVLAVVAPFIGKFAAFLDRLKFYRHHGDLRYLTDTAGGPIEKTKLLSNPPIFDRATWFWRSLASHWLMPVKSHSMAIYRNKLAEIAKLRVKTERARFGRP